MLRLAARSCAVRVAATAAAAAKPSAAALSGHWRHFSAEAEEVHPPVHVFGVGGKYASALYISAIKAKALEPVESELIQVAELLKSSPAFADFIKDPSVPKHARLAAIHDLFGEAGFSDISKNFLSVLAEGGRMTYLPKVLTAFEELLRAHRGEVLATVTSAMELTPQELTEITEALKGHLKPGENLQVDQKVDRSLIGGLVVDIGEKHIDMSIDSQIKKMEKVLQDAL